MSEKSRQVTFGTRIRELRLKLGISQRDLASRVSKRLREEERRGFDFTYLSKIENDRLDHYPSAPAILALASELNADGDELLALAGKTAPDIGRVFQSSEGARTFFRSAISRDLTEEDWQDLLEDLRRRKKNDE